MVSTRHHPKAFPEPSSPTPSPSKAVTKSTTSSPTKRSTSSPTSSPTSSSGWSHTPSNLVIAWLWISLPLIFWDTGYVLLRPHSMTGGSLHSPIWKPYTLYATIDYIYGFPAWNAHNGFTGAQGAMNIVESIMYAFYLWIIGTKAKSKTKGGSNIVNWWFKDQKIVPGKMGSIGLLVAYSAAVMTLAKTILYWANEAFSGFQNIGHNSPFNLIFLWIIPNGAWLVFPTYMAYIYGADIVDGLAAVEKRSQSS